MDNRAVIDPLDLTEESNRLLSIYLKRWLSNGRHIRRDQPFLVNFKFYTLAYDLLIREKVRGVWHVDVIANNKSDDTRVSLMRPVLAVINVPLEENALLTVDKKSKRSMHVQYKDALREFGLMQSCSFFKARGLFGSIPSMISTIRPRGESLLEVLNRDRRIMDISIDKRFQMSIELLRTLKTKIHDVGICHKGIKPDTLYYDRESGEFTFIELDISRKITDTSDMRSRGSAVFSPPEEFTSIRTGLPVTESEFDARVGRKSLANFKSDVYAAARVIGLIWHDMDSIFTDKYVVNDILLKRIRDGWIPQFNLFHRISGLSQSEKYNIAEILIEMTNFANDDRPDLATCIATFQRLYLNYQLNNLPEALRQDIKVSHELATKLFEDIAMLRSKSEIIQRFSAAVEVLPENEDAVKHFIDASGIKCLKGLTLKTELISKVEAVYALFALYQQSLESWLTQTDLPDSVSHKLEVERLLGSVKDNCCSIDAVAEAAEHFHRKLMKLENERAQYFEIKKRANPRMN